MTVSFCIDSAIDQSAHPEISHIEKDMLWKLSISVVNHSYLYIISQFTQKVNCFIQIQNWYMRSLYLLISNLPLVLLK